MCRKLVLRELYPEVEKIFRNRCIQKKKNGYKGAVLGFGGFFNGASPGFEGCDDAYFADF